MQSGKERVILHLDRGIEENRESVRMRGRIKRGAEIRAIDE